MVHPTRFELAIAGVCAMALVAGAAVGNAGHGESAIDDVLSRIDVELERLKAMDAGGESAADAVYEVVEPISVATPGLLSASERAGREEAGIKTAQPKAAPKLLSPKQIYLRALAREQLKWVEPLAHRLVNVRWNRVTSQPDLLLHKTVDTASYMGFIDLAAINDEDPPPIVDKMSDLIKTLATPDGEVAEVAEEETDTPEPAVLEPAEVELDPVETEIAEAQSSETEPPVEIAVAQPTEEAPSSQSKADAPEVSVPEKSEPVIEVTEVAEVQSPEPEEVEEAEAPAAVAEVTEFEPQIMTAEVAEVEPAPAPVETIEPEAKPAAQVKPLAPVAAQAPRIELPPPIKRPVTRPVVPAWTGDPMDQPVTVDFRGMDINQVVAILARKADINVIAGKDVEGSVTVSFKDVPLRQAMETVLRIEGYGMVEEEGIYTIMGYEESKLAKRVTKAIFLKGSPAEEVKGTLDDLLTNSREETMSVSASKTTNVLILSGPEEMVEEYAAIVRQLDVTKATLPTVTEIFPLNYAHAEDVVKMLQPLISEVGKISADSRARQIILTDAPAVVDQARAIVAQLDMPVKQVMIDIMVVDALLTDSSQTGVDWVMNLVRRTSTRGGIIGNLQDMSLSTGMGAAVSNNLTFGLLSSDFDIRANIAAEVNNSNAELVANPVVATLENTEARINISQEIAYRELTESQQGGVLSSTAFKDIGTVLTVTPRVTHQNDVIVDLSIKQSDTAGLSANGIPIENKREMTTRLRTRDGQSIFIGGLRSSDDEHDVRKVPILGDIPVMNVLFKHNTVTQKRNELLIFLTCHVQGDNLPELTPYEQTKIDILGGKAHVPDSQRALFHDILKPGEMRDPAWKWRRKK